MAEESKQAQQVSCKFEEEPLHFPPGFRAESALVGGGVVVPVS